MDLTPYTSSFPLEIVEYISDYLWNDQSSIRVCSLTSTIWYTACRPHLFRKVTLGCFKKLRELDALLCLNPKLGYWIKELRVTEPQHILPVLQCPHENTSPFPQWIYHLPAILPLKLVKLRHIEFVQLKGTTFSPEELVPSLPSLRRCFPSVKSLSFIGCHIVKDALRFFLAAFCEVEDIHLHNSYGDASRTWLLDTLSPPDTLSPSLLPRKVKTLRIHDSNNEQSLPFLLDTIHANAYTHLETLHLHVHSHWHLQHAGEFLGLVGPSLCDLELALPTRARWPALQRQIEAVQEHIDLSGATNLHKLSLHDPAHPAMPSLLSRIASKNLNHITFYISFDRWNDFKPKDYVSLRECLEKDNLSNVSDVRFVYAGSLDTVHKISRKVNRMFPLLRSRARVDVLKVNNHFELCFAVP